ncbi:metallophosphoesterase [Candidatus Uabimicrobium sp. HlEnr_7]|uniref:metallophosphoesterase family protein n=1 Tax=Candidatus Uabimicrobium helgolandensis TaxID=3095367 RepID=UPI003557C735
METTIGFIGHSHVPIVFFKNGNFSQEQHLTFDQNTSVIVNVGSVGQPRDGNPKACCAIYDSDTKHISTHRIEYDIEKAIQKINATNILPEISGKRLWYGR